MIIFELFLSILEASIIFRGSQDKYKNCLELKTKPPTTIFLIHVKTQSVKHAVFTLFSLYIVSKEHTVVKNLFQLIVRKTNGYVIYPWIMLIMVKMMLWSGKSDYLHCY